MVRVEWRLKRRLERHGISASGLARHLEGRVSRNTVHAAARGEAGGVQFDTLAAIIGGLEELTGESLSIADVIEVVHEAQGVDPDEGPAPWEALVGLLDDPAFGPDSSERIEQDLDDALEQEIRASTTRAE